MSEHEWDAEHWPSRFMCGRVDKINRGHLNEHGERTVMVARCFLSRYHDGDHRYVYETVLADA